MYDGNAKAIDDFVFKNQDFLVLVAASNDGLNADDRTVGAPATCKNCLSVGATQLNADQVAADAVYTDPSSFCSQLSASNQPRCCLSSPSTCEMQDCCEAVVANGICFTCCNQPCKHATRAPSASNLAAFSSRGPTMDARFKPDIVAPGEAISSACAGIKPATDTQAAQAAGLLNHCSVDPFPSVNCALTVESGTSMATPLMAGASECVSTTTHAAAAPTPVSFTPTSTGTSVSISSVAFSPPALPPPPKQSAPSPKLSCAPLSLRARGRSRALSETRATTTCRCQRGTRITPSALVALCSTMRCTQRASAATASAAVLFSRCCRYISNASSVAGLAIAFDVSSNNKLWVLYSIAGIRAFKFRCASYADTTVHIVLAWSDPAGNPAALKQIVNDLDLIVFVDSGAQIFGNTQSFPDTSNTVEKVVVDCPSGSVITAIVSSGSMIS